jgi:hypothetical protein
VEIGNRQQVGFAFLQPFSSRGGLTLRAVPIAAGNGRRPLPAGSVNASGYAALRYAVSPGR